MLHVVGFTVFKNCLFYISMYLTDTKVCTPSLHCLRPVVGTSQRSQKEYSRRLFYGIRRFFPSYFFPTFTDFHEKYQNQYVHCYLLCVSCPSANEFSAILCFTSSLIKLKFLSIISTFQTNSQAKFQVDPTSRC